MIERIKETADFLKEKTGFKPLAGIILGSGLGGLVKSIEVKHSFDYSDIPNFPVSTVEGHDGKLIFGTLEGKNIVAMQGRFHYYEGYSMQQVVFPVRVLKMLGITHLFLSNAAGGLNPSFNVGNLMIIRDHINMFPDNPLRGKNLDDLGTRFPEMGETYNKGLIEKAKKIAEKNSINYQSGVYIGSSGPTLETPAEYRMFRILGADATGMSTVPEVIAARHAGLICFGISVITNMAVFDEGEEGTSHDEVQNAAGEAEPKMTLIFRELIKSL
ncbi:MAG: purine-nucleoside phosphorylase [Bacteroidetes bacterium]|nr:MAG: purine-nucleoside phosphorylase [Bacteroidota bacterium]